MSRQKKLKKSNQLLTEGRIWDLELPASLATNEKLAKIQLICDHFRK